MEPLINHIKKIISGAVIFLFCSIHPAAADITAPEMFVFDLVNQYRAAPYAHGISLGYDAAFLGQRGIRPETVFAPYVLDGELSNAAEEANFQVSDADPEAEPIPPVLARMDRISSVFSFSHFMPSETAGHIFVQNLFKKELDTGVFEFILSEKYQYAGTSADPGVVTDSRMNAWFLTLTLGSFERVADIQVLNLINQLRADPPLTQFFIQTDSSVLFQQNPRLYHLPKMQFTPVFSDDMLHHWARADAALPGASEAGEPVPVGAASDEVAAAQAAAADMPSRLDFHESYPGEFFQTATVAVSWEDMEAGRPVADLFSALLESELATWPYGAVVFSNRYTRAGAAVNLETMPAAKIPENSEITKISGTGILSVIGGSAAAADPGDPPDLPGPVPAEPDPRIYGLLFFDHDDDLIYSPGEEMAQHAVSVYAPAQPPVSGPDQSPDPALVKTVHTDNAGHFSLSLPPGRHWVFAAEKDGQTVSQTLYIQEDRFVKLGFSPPYPAPDTSL